MAEADTLSTHKLQEPITSQQAQDDEPCAQRGICTWTFGNSWLVPTGSFTHGFCTYTRGFLTLGGVALSQEGVIYEKVEDAFCLTTTITSCQSIF